MSYARSPPPVASTTMGTSAPVTGSRVNWPWVEWASPPNRSIMKCLSD